TLGDVPVLGWRVALQDAVDGPCALAAVDAVVLPEVERGHPRIMVVHHANLWCYPPQFDVGAVRVEHLLQCSALLDDHRRVDRGELCAAVVCPADLPGVLADGVAV